MLKKKIIILLSIIIFVTFMAYRFMNGYKRYETADDAIKLSGAVIYSETIDQFTLYFYQPEDSPIVYEYIYQDERGYKQPSKKIAREAKTEHQIIRHYQEKNELDIVIISACLFDKTPFEIRDNQASNFKMITFDYNGDEYTYYVSVFDSGKQDYSLFIDEVEIVDWKSINWMNSFTSYINDLL